MTTRFAREGDKQQNERHALILKKLMQLPGNRKCVDCRKKDPRWASWNIGVFMCIQCSGIHRSIGTHISKVKSADLDTWTPEQVENMIKWGNEKANIYWEHEWPKNMNPGERNMQEFIRAKYERKQYAMKGPIPDPNTIHVGSSNSPTKIITDAAPVPAKAPTQQSPSIALFDAFNSAPVQTAPPLNSHQSQKDSIMSMFGKPSPVSTTPSAAPISFADFGNASFTSAVTTKPAGTTDLLGGLSSVNFGNSSANQLPKNNTTQAQFNQKPMQSFQQQPVTSTTTSNLMDDFAGLSFTPLTQSAKPAQLGGWNASFPNTDKPATDQHGKTSIAKNDQPEARKPENWGTGSVATTANAPVDNWNAFASDIKSNPVKTDSFKTEPKPVIPANKWEPTTAVPSNDWTAAPGNNLTNENSWGESIRNSTVQDGSWGDNASKRNSTAHGDSWGSGNFQTSNSDWNIGPDKTSDTAWYTGNTANESSNANNTTDEFKISTGLNLTTVPDDPWSDFK